MAYKVDNTQQSQDTPSIKVRRIATSIESSHKQFGEGFSCWENLSAECSYSDLPDVIDHSIDMFFTAWKAIIGAQIATGLTDMKSSELRELLAKVDRRITTVKKILRDDSDPAWNEQIRARHAMAERCPVCSHTNQDEEHCGGEWHHVEVHASKS